MGGIFILSKCMQRLVGSFKSSTKYIYSIDQHQILVMSANSSAKNIASSCTEVDVSNEPKDTLTVQIVNWEHICFSKAEKIDILLTTH